MRAGEIIGIVVLLSGLYVLAEMPIATCSASLFGYCLVPSAAALLFPGQNPNVTIGTLLAIVGAVFTLIGRGK